MADSNQNQPIAAATQQTSGTTTEELVEKRDGSYQPVTAPSLAGLNQSTSNVHPFGSTK